MRRWLETWLLAAAAVIAGVATAQAQSDYPNRPVRVIVDSAPGSATDVSMRIVADRLAQIWGQQVLILNHPGAGGAIAARVAAQATPDGYTLYLLAASAALALPGAPGVAPNLPVELPRDFAPVGFVTQQPMFIAVAPSFGVSTLPELIARARQKPGEISYATTGRGRVTHLTMELLQERAGIKLQMVPYTGGPAQALNDVMGGRIPLVIEGYSGLAGGLQGGIIKGLAVASLERLAEFPDLPTVAETLPGFTAGGWNAILAPVGTPEAVVSKVGADLRTVLGIPEVKSKFATLGAYVKPMTPAEVTAFTQEQQKVWRPITEQVARQAQ